MRYGRYRGNCILWAGFSLTVCAGITFLAREIISRQLPFSIAGTALFFLLLSGLFAIVHMCRRRRTVRERGTGSALWEWLLWILLTAAAFSLRLWAACRPGEAGWFAPEAMRESNLVFALRIVLQSGGICLLYPALRRISGKTVAAVAACGCAFLPYYVRSCLESETGSLYFFFFALLLLLAAFVLHRASQTGEREWAGQIFFGLICGAAMCVDVIFAAVFLLAFPGLLFLDGPRERIRPALLCLEAAVGGFVLTALARWYWGGDFTLLRGGWRFFFEEGHMIADSSTLYGLMFLLALSALYIPGFFVQEGNIGLPWILPFLFLTGWTCLTVTRDDGQITLLIWLIFAGVGLHSMFCPCPEEPKTREETGPVCSPEGGGQRRDAKDRKPAVLLPGEPIPNPLPGPGKHVPRKLDYAFHPPEQEMCYDLNDLDENDDFEI